MEARLIKLERKNRLLYLGLALALLPWVFGAMNNTLAGQTQELQKQVMELQKTRIVASGTTTFKLAGDQDNATNVRVMLNEEIAKRIGEDYIVLLTQRFPAGGYPFFVPLWKRASDGFDITIVDVALGPNETASYANKNKSYLVDWIVVKK